MAEYWRCDAGERLKYDDDEIFTRRYMREFDDDGARRSTPLPQLAAADMLDGHRLFMQMLDFCDGHVEYLPRLADMYAVVGRVYCTKFRRY